MDKNNANTNEEIEHYLLPPLVEIIEQYMYDFALHDNKIFICHLSGFPMYWDDCDKGYSVMLIDIPCPVEKEENVQTRFLNYSNHVYHLTLKRADESQTYVDWNKRVIKSRTYENCNNGIAARCLGWRVDFLENGVE